MDQTDHGIMTYFEAEAHSFVVRLWRENGETPSVSSEWRGWIEHVQSAKRHYFRQIAEISAIVATYVEGASPQILDDQVFLPVQSKGDGE